MPADAIKLSPTQSIDPIRKGVAICLELFSALFDRCSIPSLIAKTDPLPFGLMAISVKVFAPV